MEKIILLLVFITTNTALAQQDLATEQFVKFQDDLIKKELILSEYQEKAVSEINLRYAKKQKQLMDEEGSMFSKMGDMKNIKDRKSKELQNVLNKEQFKIYEDKVEPQIKNYMRKHLKK